MQSGVANSAFVPVWEPLKYVRRLCKKLGFRSEDPKEVVEFLRKVSIKDLLDAQNKILLPEVCIKLNSNLDFIWTWFELSFNI